MQEYKAQTNYRHWKNARLLNIIGQKQMDISIVIPAFEESKKISRDIEAASGFLESNHLTGEIIVVDDGSCDGTVEAAEKTAVASGTILKVLRLPHHTGKGAAVRTGIKQTSGEYVMFADSGCCVPYDNVLDGLKLLKTGACDIAHGSRKIPESIIRNAQSRYRRTCARIFHWFVIYFMKLPAELTDTQCGFKIYKGQVGRKLYEDCVTNGFMFDVEIILRAMKAGHRIKEFPIEWTCDRDSRLSPAKNLWRVLSELMAIKKVLSKE
ncbi:MAG: glycosyltransferase [Phycisphaerae bacterium]|nr:glycosyltransferase [Phycisphaerae bacterium]